MLLRGGKSNKIIRICSRGGWAHRDLPCPFWIVTPGFSFPSPSSPSSSSSIKTPAAGPLCVPLPPALPSPNPGPIQLLIHLHSFCPPRPGMERRKGLHYAAPRFQGSKDLAPKSLGSGTPYTSPDMPSSGILGHRTPGSWPQRIERCWNSSPRRSWDPRFVCISGSEL